MAKINQVDTVFSQNDRMREGLSVQSDFRSSLNALRGIAAMIVVFYHLPHTTTFDWFGAVPALSFGYLGVDLFFILSGLIISHVYLDKSALAVPGFWTNFLWLRIARLFPVHLVIMVSLLAAALVGPVYDTTWSKVTPQQWFDWISVTFLFRQWLLPYAYAWNGPAWSISAELFAYVAIFPVIAMANRKMDSDQLGKLLMGLGAVIFMLIIGLSGTMNATHGVGPLLRVTAGFMTGAGLFLILDRKIISVNWNRIFLWAAALTLPTLAISLWLKSTHIAPDLLLLALIVAVICATYNLCGKVAKFLSSAPLFWLGEISFSLYLCHKPVSRALAYVAQLIELDRGFLFGVLQVSTSIAVAHLLFRFVEIPSRNAMRGWYDWISVQPCSDIKSLIPFKRNYISQSSGSKTADSETV